MTAVFAQLIALMGPGAVCPKPSAPTSPPPPKPKG